MGIRWTAKTQQNEVRLHGEETRDGIHFGISEKITLQNHGVSACLSLLYENLATRTH